MTHGKVRYSDFAVTDAILVCLNLSEDYHTGIYYYFLASFAPTFLDRANNYYHKSYAGFERASLFPVTAGMYNYYEV